MEPAGKDYIEHAARLLAGRSHAIALTGAGISTGCGIPDFRGTHGLWKRYNPSVYASMDTFRSDPRKVWELTLALNELSNNVKPGPGHRALALMEREGFLQAIITQNIDGLHRAAGSGHVIEFHGSLGTVVCPACRYRADARAGGPADDSVQVPLCPVCGGPLKPGFTLFGETVPPAAYLEATNLAGSCDLFLVIGTSAHVQPAADLPFIARKNGAMIIEMNLEPTGLTNYITDVFIPGPVDETLPLLFERVGKMTAAGWDY